MRRRGRNWAVLVCAALALILTPGVSAGQITITRINNLTFGTVTAGIATDVRYSDAGAAKFQLQAPRNALLLLTVLPPSGLTGPGSAIPFSTTTTSGAWSAQDRTTGATTFDPSQPVQARAPGSGRLFVWIGGRLSPPISQTAGSYTGTLTVSAVQQ